MCNSNTSHNLYLQRFAEFAKRREFIFIWGFIRHDTHIGTSALIQYKDAVLLA